MLALIAHNLGELQSISDQNEPFFNLQLGHILVAQGVISTVQLHEALSHQEAHPDKRLGALLIHMAYATEAQIHDSLMHKFAIPRASLEAFDIPRDILELLAPDLIVAHSILPLGIIKHRLFLAMADPLDYRLISQVEDWVHKSVEPVLAPSADILHLIHVHCSHALTKMQTRKDQQITEFPDPQSISETFTTDLEDESSSHTEKTVPEIEVKIATEKSMIKDRFILETVLGSGGMGTVYKALDLRRAEAKDRQCYVALKVLNDNFRDHPAAFITMQREASKTQMLSHPNIVTVNDFDRDGDTIYIIMEYLEGRALSDILKYDYPQGMPYGLAMRIVKDLASALEFAHQNHIIHCDFKPGNAFITNNQQVKVIDFGIARVSSAAQQPVNFCDAGIVSGCTPSYATTELFYGEEPLPSDDVYALACATYKMLTGVHPFQKNSSVEAKRLGLKPKRISCLSQRQWKGLQRALSFSREVRTASARQFIRDLQPKKLPPVVISLLILVGVLLAVIYFLMFG